MAGESKESLVALIFCKVGQKDRRAVSEGGAVFIGPSSQPEELHIKRDGTKL